MAKPKITTKTLSYGIYSKWDRNSKELPKIKDFTYIVPAKIDIEFGFIINIKKAKGKKMYYCIEHPPFTDESGEIMPPFDGIEYVQSNDWNFYLGDTIWAPIEDKTGIWRMFVEIDGNILEDKCFEIV